MQVSRRTTLFRKAARFTGLGLIAVCIVRVSLWHVENDIREAAYRYSFRHLYHNRSSWKVSFIGIIYGCSSDYPRVPVLTTPFLLNRFAGCKPPVKPASECLYPDECGEQTADKVTGKTGAVFYTGAIWWVSWDTVRIEAGYYEGMLSSSGNVLTLKRKNGRWVVVKNEMVYIS